MSKFSTPFFKKSPILGAYESAADGRAFMGGLVSGQQQFAKLQQDITKSFESIIAGEDYSENQAERLQKRINRREKRADNKGADGRIISKTTGDVIADLNPKKTKFDRKTQKLRKRKERVDKEIEKKKKGKRSQNFLTAAEKTEIVKQHFLDQNVNWNDLTPQQKKEAVKDYRNYYGFN